jgi:hypothetical protein
MFPQRRWRRSASFAHRAGTGASAIVETAGDASTAQRNTPLCRPMTIQGQHSTFASSFMIRNFDPGVTA